MESLTSVWTAADDARLKHLVASMWPLPKILAEFSDHPANAVRTHLADLLTPPDVGLDRAVAILGDRARRVRRGTGFLLDGCPATPARLVGTANLVLYHYGFRPIAYPGV